MRRERLKQAKTEAEWQRALEEFARELAACGSDPDAYTTWEDNLPVDEGMEEEDEDDTRVIIWP